MTTLFLVRHAAHDLLGRVLTGRMAGVYLGVQGRRQAEMLAARLSRESIAAVYASPLERAQETAAPVAAQLGLTVQAADDVTDIDFGEWSGAEFQALDGDPRWSAWNETRGTAWPPGGESMPEVQRRAVGALERVCAAHPDSGAVVVSHADVIKAMIAHYLGLGLDAIGRFEISPASISTVAVGAWGAKVLTVNETVAA
jgi:probable phosphoglycerate mutase